MISVVSQMYCLGLNEMSKTFNVFILAAGLGERMRPITYHIPKPLLPILGKPVLQLVLERVSPLPVNKIGINLHHKKDAIEDWIKQNFLNEMTISNYKKDKNYPSPIPLPQGEGVRGRVEDAFSGKKIILFHEEQILGTGGALKNAESFLNRGTFLVHNSDILSDINLGRLLEYHFSSKNLVTLAVHDYPKFNNVDIDENGFLKGIERINENRNDSRDGCPTPTANGNLTPVGQASRLSEQVFSRRKSAFTGIAVYEPEFLKFLPFGTSSVVDAWLKAMSAGYKIGTLDVSGYYWSDIGTPNAYAAAVFDALKADGEVVYIYPSVKRCKNIDLQGYVVIEKGCIIDKGISLRNCIVLPGSHIGNLLKGSENYPSPIPLPQGEGARGRVEEIFSLENCIFGPDFKIDLDEAEILGVSIDNGKQLIGTGGSDRKYYRIRKGDKSVVLMHCNIDDPDFERQIEYTRFFLKHSIPVPELIEVELEKKQAIFEEAGDISLYSFLKCPREETEIENIYRQVIDVMVMIHTEATEHAAECPLLREKIFDYEYFRWETNYFIERFVEGIKNIKLQNAATLDEEFHHLAFKADSFSKTIIHRDFQSQNIMILKDQKMRIIDYQGIRIGPPAYDVASILWDPYYHLDVNMRERLLEYYIGKMRNSYCGIDVKENENYPSPIPLPQGEGARGRVENGAEEKFDEDYFRETLLPCRLQRHMQALGAYGFLSSLKGKKYFLKYAPEGLRLLKEDVSLSKNEYPTLYSLVMKL